MRSIDLPLTGNVVAQQAAIEIRDLTLSFTAGTPTIDRVSLTVPHGQFLSIVGPSGCGKTTMLNLLAGLIHVPHSGTVRIQGREPRLGDHGIAYMLARDSLLPWRTALENAAYGMEVRGVAAERRRERARDLLVRVGLGGFEKSYPKQLSHGMRQRCALARTFALDSPILLMDEPFGALDAQTKLQLEELLVDLWQEERRTVVFITHDLGEAIAISDRVVVMGARPGRIVTDVEIPIKRPRSVRELQKDHVYHELYAHIWEMLEQGYKK
ncbi:ABC transporter ATP-binding protein [Aromatoleum toluolicum]|uniref:ABC transporter ATP-binding protein n=1 Tax=Aromatoleum toluolicum TaxID=90060 RepID=UPI001B7CEF05|nr:ABC transporter ATP-binding protein [Aromatoleum toluolicum]NMF99530.2 ABC transporter ATP-binding protein [Aromatoleum toluolicum]